MRAKIISHSAQHWIDRALPSNVLHVFPHACNLINHRQEILSLVTERVVRAPFAVVMDSGKEGRGEWSFLDLINPRSEVSFHGGSLSIDGITILISDAERWDPKISIPSVSKMFVSLSRYLPIMIALVNSASLSSSCARILGHLLPSSDGRIAPQTNTIFDHALSSMIVPARSLCKGLRSNDLPECRLAAAELIGLGPGLTPSGDDFVMGAILGYRVLHPQDLTCESLGEVVEELKGRSNSLSMAFLRCAAKGEASIVWHELLNAMMQDSESQLTNACHQILQIGHSSGADSLTGFLTAVSWLSQ